MQNKSIHIVIDQGNTLTKVALFQEDEIYKVVKCSEFTPDFWSEFILQNVPSIVIFSSVKGEVPLFLKNYSYQFIVFNQELKFNFSNLYSTPKTLGVDRIANVVAAVNQELLPALVIDIGSCITYDVINNQKEYIGGAISPGIQLRFKSMHQFTGKLPMIEFQSNQYFPEIIGKDTQSCLKSGVIWGIKSEIERYVFELSKKYEGLTIFLTGGDASFFDLELKNHIFANAHLTLMGLHEILKINASR